MRIQEEGRRGRRAVATLSAATAAIPLLPTAAGPIVIWCLALYPWSGGTPPRARVRSCPVSCVLDCAVTV